MVREPVREADEEKLLERFLDDESLVAGYRVVEVLGRDPWRHMTYEAATAEGRRVLLKVIDARAGESRRSRIRRRRRLRLRASLQHPNLLPVLDWGKAGDRLYIAMPLSRAPTLADVLREAPLAATRALPLLGQIADALEAAHERGLVHRELVPEHVLVEPQEGGHVLLGDFGAGDPDWSSGLHDPAASPRYVSPEQLRGEPLTPQSNVYSLTGMLVECLTGSPPQRSEQSGSRLSLAHAELPVSLDDMVEAGLAEDPAERLSSPRQLVSAGAVALGVEIPAPPVQGDGRRRPPARPRDHRRARALGAARSPAPSSNVLALVLAAVVACGAAGFLLARSGDDAVDSGTARSAAAQPERRSGLRAIDRALERLDARRAVLRRRLAGASTFSAQAAEAGRLAGAYRAARRMVPRTSGPEAQVASALGEAEWAYGHLATTARGRARARYDAAARAVLRAEADLEQAVLSTSARR